MPFKVGLNRQEQIQCAKALAEGVDPKAIAKKFRTSEEVVKRFTQEKLDAAKARAKAREDEIKETKEANAGKAAVLREALAQGEFK